MWEYFFPHYVANEPLHLSSQRDIEITFQLAGRYCLSLGIVFTPQNCLTMRSQVKWDSSQVCKYTNDLLGICWQNSLRRKSPLHLFFTIYLLDHLFPHCSWGPCPLPQPIHHHTCRDHRIRERLRLEEMSGCHLSLKQILLFFFFSWILSLILLANNLPIPPNFFPKTHFMFMLSLW